MERAAQRKTDNHLLKVPYDVLHLILGRLKGKEWLPLTSVSRFQDHLHAGTPDGGHAKTALLNLSVTCKALRRMCLPRLFVFVSLHNQALDSSLRSIFVHTRRVLVNCTPEHFSEFMSLAPNARETYFKRCDPPLLPALQSDSHEVVALSKARSFRHCFPLAKVRAPLRIFRMCVPDRHFQLASSEADLSDAKMWLEAFLPQVRSSLEILVLPAQPLRLSLLAEAPWGKLRELVLYGASPTVDISLLRIFDMMPDLRAFSCMVALRYSQPPLVIWPQNATETPDISRLRRFTLSSPSVKDCIFAHLPIELEELSFRDSPRFYDRSRFPNSRNTIDTTFRPGVPTCGEVLSIFETLRCASLVHLELVVIEDERELDLLAYIADACPRLVFLEFHCYRNIFEYDDLMTEPLLVPLNDLAQALSAFKTLQDLRLNIDTPWVQATPSAYRDPPLRDAADASRKFAQIFAQAVPWLNTVTILTRDNTRLPEWVLWSVRDIGNAVDVERIVVKDTVDYYKTIDA